jgi:hypothetical protein
MNPKTKDSITEAEIQNLLDGWIQARRKVWDAWFGLATAKVPAPWHEFLEQSVTSYEQMLESLLKAQAAGVSTALRAFGPLNTWAEGIQRLAETMVDTQRKIGEAWSAAPEETSSSMTSLSPLVEGSGAAQAASARSSRSASTGATKEAPPPSKAGQQPTAAA